jgi:hypothetical protein
MRKLVLQHTWTERSTRRQKRRTFNSAGLVAHSLFGVLDSDNEAFYNEKFVGGGAVGLAEVNARTDYCCWPILKSVNQIVHDVSTNELSLTKELQNILNFINVGC